MASQQTYVHTLAKFLFCNLCQSNVWENWEEMCSFSTVIRLQSGPVSAEVEKEAGGDKVLGM